MLYAIIDAVSDIDELITVSYGETVGELAKWFIDEVKENADMYLSDEADFEMIDDACEQLEVLCEDDDSVNVSDMEGITVEAGDISISIIGAYYTYEEMKKALEEFISQKPKFKKIKVPDNENEKISVIDELNCMLIKSGI